MSGNIESWTAVSRGAAASNGGGEIWSAVASSGARSGAMSDNKIWLPEPEEKAAEESAGAGGGVRGGRRRSRWGGGKGPDRPKLRDHRRFPRRPIQVGILSHILETAKRIAASNKVVKLYTTEYGMAGWNRKGMNLDHPMTFETLAMDGDLKERVIEDLEGFMKGKEYYKKIGKVWKRGYLLYGPPGTGKSSLIAAMANYLNYDIYNLNLSAVMSDSSLEYLLLHMSNRSLLVVEDIDCSVVLHNRVAPGRKPGPSTRELGRTQITLSGLLNAIDGLLSCCGDERIIVFTTNYKDRIEPALLRAGRMDMHIYLSYCTFSTFKQLAFNYLDMLDHPLFSHIEKLIGEVETTPAEVAGELMKIRSPQASLENLINFLENKKAEAKLASQGTEMKTENDNATPVKVKKKKRVKEECESSGKSKFSKYGDIGANNVGDLQSAGLVIARLHQKLDAILQALPVDQKGTRPFEKMDENPKFDDDGTRALI